MNAKKEVPGSAWETSRLLKAKQKGNQPTKDKQRKQHTKAQRPGLDTHLNCKFRPFVISKCVHLGDCGDGSVDKDSLNVGPYTTFKK